MHEADNRGTSSAWERVRLDEIAQVNSETLGASTEPDFQFTYIDISSVQRGRIIWDHLNKHSFREAPSRARRLVSCGDVLFGTVRPSLQSHAYVDKDLGPMVCSTGFCVIRAMDGKAQGRYLAHWVLSQEVAKSAQQAEVGSNYPAVTESDVKGFTLHLPPLPEQRRIAEILDSLDETIRQTEQVVAKLKQMKQGLLHDLLTRGIDENGELRDPERYPEQFKDSPLGRIPREWEVETVEGLFEMQLGKMLNTAARAGRNPAYYLANRNVQWNFVDLEDLDWMDFTPAERERYSLRPGDLLVCEGGEVGRTALWRGERTDCFFQKAIHRLRARTERIMPEYMLRFMRWAADIRLLFHYTSQSSIAHLTREKLAIVPVTLPSIREQERICAAFDHLDQRVHSEDGLLHKLRLLKQGLMDDLLTGRVRVPVAEEVSS